MRTVRAGLNRVSASRIPGSWLARLNDRGHAYFPVIGRARLPSISAVSGASMQTPWFIDEHRNRVLLTLLSCATSLIFESVLATFACQQWRKMYHFVYVQPV